MIDYKQRFEELITQSNINYCVKVIINDKKNDFIDNSDFIEASERLFSKIELILNSYNVFCTKRTPNIVLADRNTKMRFQKGADFECELSSWMSSRVIKAVITFSPSCRSAVDITYRSGSDDWVILRDHLNNIELGPPSEEGVYKLLNFLIKGQDEE